MAGKTIEVALVKLLLDNENPRHDPINNEPEIIATLVKKEQVIPLAKSIVEEGALNPLERIGVIKHPTVRGAYVVAEGNRRACALKLLHDPDKAPASVRTMVRKLADEVHGRLPAKIEVVEFKDEAEARPWKRIRHEGEQGGVGTRPWTAAQKARHAHAGGSSNPNAVALQLLDYAQSRGLVTPGDRLKIAITTITRYLSNPVLRNAIGLASSSSLTIDAPQDQFDRAVESFLGDALPTGDGGAPTVHSRSNAKERAAYASVLRDRGVSPADRLEVPIEPNFKPRTKVKRNNRSPDLRPYVVPVDFRASIRATVLKRIFDELRKIEPSFSFAAAYLLRAFFEQLARQYASDHKLGKSGELHAVVGRCLEHLSKNKALAEELGGAKVLENTLKPLRTSASDRDSRISPESLGNWVHGGEIPTGAEIKRRWDTLEGGFRLMLDGLK